jgi:adenylate kinase family enzyme
MNKRILIIGDGGRGKTTFAEKLSKKTGIPFYSVDDFFWKTKFSEPADKQQSVQAIEEVYKRDEWIVEGGSRPLIKTGIEKADIIYLLKFNSIIASPVKRRCQKRREREGAREKVKDKHCARVNEKREK